MSDIIDIKTGDPYKIGTVKNYGYDNITQDSSMGGAWDTETRAFLESHNLKGLFFDENWVFITLDLVSDYVSRSRMVVVKETVDNDGGVKESISKSHPVLTILDHPNPFQEYTQFIYNYCVELDLMGNTIVFYGAQKKTLFILPAETVTLSS